MFQIHRRHKFDHHTRFLEDQLVSFGGYQRSPIGLIPQWCIEQSGKKNHYHILLQKSVLMIGDWAFHSHIYWICVKVNSPRWAKGKWSFRSPCIWVDIKQFYVGIAVITVTNGNNFVFDITKWSQIMFIDRIWMIRIYFTIITEIFNLIRNVLNCLVVTWNISSYH